MPEGQNDKLYSKQRYFSCVLVICDGSWSLGVLGGAFLGTGIEIYFKLY